LAEAVIGLEVTISLGSIPSRFAFVDTMASVLNTLFR